MTAALLLPIVASAEALPAQREALEDWQGARRRVVLEEGWRRWLEQESARVENWMTASPEREDLEAGWIHDYQEASSGAFSTWTPGQSCGEAGAGDRSTAGCIALVRHHHVATMQAAARLGILLEQRRMIDWAAGQLDMYVRLHARQSQARQGQPVLFRQGLDEANALPALADTVRLLRPHVAVEQAGSWCTGLLQPIGSRLLAAQREVHNIAVWYAAATAVAAMECNDGALLYQSTAGPWAVERLLEKGTSDDGFWFELSLSYQNYVVRAVHEVLLAAALRGRPDFLPLHPLARALMTSPYRVRFDGSDAPTINDNNRYLRIPDIGLLHAVRRLLPTESGDEAARETTDWDTLLDPPTGEAAHSLLPENEAGGTALPGLRSLFLRSGGWQALLRAGQAAPFHAHQDTLAYELKHDGQWLFRNSATPAYGSDRHRLYYKLAAAHTSPLVNGLGVSNWFSLPSQAHTGPDSIEAGYRSFQRNVGVRRRLHASDAAFTDQLTFAPAGAGAASLGAVYHSDCMLSPGRQPSAPAPLPAAPGFAYVEPIGSWRGNREWTGMLKCAARSYRLRLSGSLPLDVTLAAAPALQPPRQRTVLLVALVSAREAWIRLELTPLAPGVQEAYR
ncbi:MAG TPA: heparinase II/III family protein [Noviherbaspirillum sp.]|uniref:heparinase II/III domain-containing protein n=1 Tax=Noviherbaspirillum sp. TaxID=1926288 RepID=UPI002F945107